MVRRNPITLSSDITSRQLVILYQAWRGRHRSRGGLFYAVNRPPQVQRRTMAALTEVGYLTEAGFGVTGREEWYLTDKADAKAAEYGWQSRG